MIWGGVAVGGYFAWKWWQSRQQPAAALPQAAAPQPQQGLSGARDQYDVEQSPRWYGYGRTQDTISDAQAFGKETAQTQGQSPGPNIAVGDVEEAPYDFSDGGEWTEGGGDF